MIKILSLYKIKIKYLMNFFFFFFFIYIYIYKLLPNVNSLKINIYFPGFPTTY